MKQLSLSRMAAVACILCASSVGASAAQSKHGSDPARWYKGDSTQQQRMNVLKKELNAAYAEQSAACKKKPSSKRSACLREARANFKRDSANARRLVANPPQSEVTERVVQVTPAGGATGAQPGASAYGGSAAGQTGMGTGQGMSGAPQAGTPRTGAQQSGASQTGAEQSGAAGYGSSQSMGASTPPVQSGAQSGTQSGAQSGHDSSGAQSGYSTSGAGATGAGTNESGAPVNGPTQSGSNNVNGSQSGTATEQSIGAGTGATQSDTQDQPRGGAVPPVQR